MQQKLHVRKIERMIISDEEISGIGNVDEDHTIAIVGCFPFCKVGNFTYPEGDICLKYGKQDNKNLHRGFGLLHLIKGAHTEDEIYKDVKTIDELVVVLKRTIKKHSKIFMEREGNFIVISNGNAKVVLEYRDSETMYSVVTCHNISNTYNVAKHGDSVGKIKKDLTNV
ncbi:MULTISPECIES: hypothetical protein [Pasteurellaceae]|uniref:Uncharacterized protein n=3 Tax=Pasteurellaceae TaxID=712 RepID=Q5I228_GLAPU|nr:MULTISPECIES: hypothetical protein [Pasteurellaceae]AAW51473.1 unknown [Glaesserella parasuis]MDA3979804.1 hypothetical protein [Gallibacterium sp. AGMB14963]MDG6346844.1 hypothetical protein [Glaesserella parasuis]CAJ65902.1 hypothetical protein [Bibersteinia trehalosi]